MILWQFLRLCFWFVAMLFLAAFVTLGIIAVAVVWIGLATVALCQMIVRRTT